MPDIPVDPSQPVSNRQSVLTSGRTPAGHRVLHAIVPEPVFWHVKAMAFKSRLPFKVYLARFLAEAKEYASSVSVDPSPRHALGEEPTHAPLVPSVGRATVPAEDDDRDSANPTKEIST